MTNYLVSRHAGTIAWVTDRHGMLAHVVEHWPPDGVTVGKGDVVYGTLPLHHAADVCRQGARYVHLVIPIPADRRDDELGANDLDALGAKLVEYRIEEVTSLERGE